MQRLVKEKLSIKSGTRSSWWHRVLQKTSHNKFNKSVDSFCPAGPSSKSVHRVACDLTLSPLCVVGEAGEKEKESARGTMGRGKREERRPPRAFYFFDYFILMGIPSGSLCGGESDLTCDQVKKGRRTA